MSGRETRLSQENRFRGCVQDTGSAEGLRWGNPGGDAEKYTQFGPPVGVASLGSSLAGPGETLLIGSRNDLVAAIHYTLYFYVLRDGFDVPFTFCVCGQSMKSRVRTYPSGPFFGPKVFWIPGRVIFFL